MGLYLCRWPNGDLSLATGKHILPLLDEQADPSPVHLIPIDSMAVHFRLTENGSLELQEFNGSFHRYLEQALPKVRAAQHKIIVNEGEPTEQNMKQALKQERARRVSENIFKVLEQNGEDEIGL